MAQFWRSFCLNRTQNQVILAAVKECNNSFPRDNPICAAIIFGEKDYFLNNKQKAICLQTGGGLRYFIKLHYTEFYDQPKAPLPPPAPNISPPRHPHRYSIRQLNTSSNTSNMSTTRYSCKLPEIIQSPPPTPRPRPGEREENGGPAREV